MLKTGIIHTGFVLVFLAFGLMTTDAYAQNVVVREAQRITGDSFPIVIRTPQGANIYAVSRPSAAMIQAIDKGLTDLFAVSRKNGYGKHLN
jgi:hypothetical protein